MVVISAGLFYIWFYFIFKDEEAILSFKKQELLAIADLKVNQINNWRNERMADAEVFRKNTHLIKELNGYFNNSISKEMRGEIELWLKSYRELYGYKEIYMFDKFNKPKFILTEKKVILCNNMKVFIDSAKARGASFFADYHRDSLMGIHISVIIPLYIYQKKEKIFVGSVALIIDPADFLDPLIQQWPTISKTSETLLLKPVDDSIVFLNGLRHRKNTALNLKIPVSDTNVLGVKAVNGAIGLVEGLDYRHKRVIGVISRIPDTNWFLITKTDWDEINNPLFEKKILSLGILFIFLIIAGLSFWYYRNRQFSAIYKRNYEVILEKQALSKRFEYLTKYANDIILMIDDNIRVQEANFSALHEYGYSEEELIGMPVYELRINLENVDIDNIKRNLDNNDGQMYETFHKRKDGSVFPVEVSSRKYFIEEKVFYQEIIRNISDRKSAENQREEAVRKLIESEERFRNIFEHASVGKSITSLDGSLYVNHALSAILGYSRDELSKIKWQDITHPDDIDRDGSIINSVIKGDRNSARWKKRYIHKNGDIVWVDISTVLQYDSSGLPLYFITTIMDISNEIKIQEELSRSKERFQRAMENIPDIIVIYDPELRIQFINPSGKNITGFNVNDFFGKKDEEVFQPDVYQSYLPYLKESLDTKSKIFVDTQITFNRFGKKNLHIIYIPILDKNNEIIEMLGVMHDYTERKQAEDNIRHKDELLETEHIKIQSLLDISSGLYIATTFKEIGRTVSNVFEKYRIGVVIGIKLAVYDEEEDKYEIVYIFGEDDDEQNKLFTYVAKPCALSEVMYYSKIAIEQKCTLYIEDNYSDYSLNIDIRQKELERACMLFIPLFNGDTLIGLLSFARSPENSMDKEFIEFLEHSAQIVSTAIGKLLIEKKKTKVEKQIVQLNEDLEERVIERTAKLESAIKDLESFSYSISHDLRAPLRAINGFSRILVAQFTKDLDKTALHYLDNIIEASDRMNKLIEDILYYSRLGRKSISYVSIPIKELYEKIISDYTDIIRSNNDIIMINSTIEYIDSDKTLLSLIMTNLIDNAVKYRRLNSRNEILIDISEEERFYTIKIKDTGIGIAPEFHDKIYNVFQRLHSEDEYPGTGIGLAIVKKAVEMLNGEVGILSSVLNEGTTFYVKLFKEDCDG